MVQEEKYFDYSSRAIYLRAIVLGGLKGVAYAAFSIMSPILMSVGGVVAIEIKAILLTSFIGLAAGTLHLAIAQYVSVYTQYDILTFQAKRNIRMGRGGKKGPVPSPTLVAVASSVTYLVGGSVLLLAAGFIKKKEWRSSAVMTLASLSLFFVGVIGAALGRAPVARSCARVLLGGWLTICITWGKSKILEHFGL
ncbi:hypothetical protein ACB092_05G238100 [Castanea dentata]